MTFIQCKLTLNPNLCVNNLTKKFDSIRNFLWLGGQVSYDTYATLMIFSFSDNNDHIIFVETKIFTVLEVFVSSKWNLFSETFEVGTYVFICKLSSWKIELMISILVEIFCGVWLPSIGFDTVEFIFVMSWWNFNLSPE